jgi:hypothetical protein
VAGLDIRLPVNLWLPPGLNSGKRLAGARRCHRLEGNANMRLLNERAPI